MKPHGLIFLLFFIGSQVCTGQTTGDNRYNFHGKGYGVFTVKIDTASLKRFKLLQNTGGSLHSNFVQPYIAADSDIFIASAEISDSLNAPMGLFISEGKTINPVDLTDGYGNVFALKPNGVFMITDKEAVITESSLATKYAKVRLAIQAIRMIVADGQIPAKIEASDKGALYRCGVGIYEYNGANYLVFATSRQPVTQYEFASLFKAGFKCNNALCLRSGGTCAMYAPFMNCTDPLDNKAIGSYIMYTNHN